MTTYLNVLSSLEYLLEKAGESHLRDALSHAIRCMELTDQFKNQMEDFDVAFAYAMAARANAAMGQINTAREYKEKALFAGEKIEDEQDRNIFFADLNSGNWFNI